jgi:protein involved in polysaccharide export with SLBB domain
MELMKLFGRGTAGLAVVFACILLAGCQSTEKPNDKAFGYNPLKGDSPNAPVAGLPDAANALANPVETGTNGIILNVGDSVIVKFSDLNSTLEAVEQQVKEDGSITLYFDEKFQAAGKTVRALQAEIRERYVPKYYVNMTPHIKTQDKFFSVGGEVKSGNRYVYTPPMTVLRATDVAGGFTDFARKGKVTVTRGTTGAQETEDCVKARKHPELDLPVYPGDTVFVPKRIW